MNDRKALKFIRGILIASGAVLLLCAVFTFVTDPFYQYHGPWFSEGAYLDRAVYQTAGAARNLEYEDVILGSSMTENFRVSEFNDLFGWNTVKLSYSGCWTDDLKAVLGQIYKTHTVDHMVLSVDMYQYMEEDSAVRVCTERPSYLYTTSILDDAPYLWNMDVLGEGAGLILKALSGNGPDADDSYTWDHPTGLDVVLASYLDEREQALQADHEMLPSDAFIESTQAAMNNIEPFIREHPETEFYLFFPAYSMLYWDQMNVHGETDAVIGATKYLVSTYLAYDNVRIWYFPQAPVTEDLSRYLDTGHHDAGVSHDEMVWMHDGIYELTPDNYEEVLDAMLLKARTYDYSIYFQ